MLVSCALDLFHVVEVPYLRLQRLQLGHPVHNFLRLVAEKRLPVALYVRRLGRQLSLQFRHLLKLKSLLRTCTSLSAILHHFLLTVIPEFYSISVKLFDLIGIVWFQVAVVTR